MSASPAIRTYGMVTVTGVQSMLSMMQDASWIKYGGTQKTQRGGGILVFTNVPLKRLTPEVFSARNALLFGGQALFGPTNGAYSDLPDPLTGFKGAYFENQSRG